MPSWDVDQSSRYITIRVKASPFKITIIQAYAPRTDYDDNDSEHFYDQLQEVVDQTPKKDIIVVWGDWSAKIEDACKNWKGTCDQNCKPETNKTRLEAARILQLQQPEGGEHTWFTQTI